MSSDDFEPALVSLAVTATGKMEMPPAVPMSNNDKDPKKSTRQVYFSGSWHDSVVYDGHAISEGANIPGPSIIEYDHACTVLPPNANATVDKYGNLIIDLS